MPRRGAGRRLETNAPAATARGGAIWWTILAQQQDQQNWDSNEPEDWAELAAGFGCSGSGTADQRRHRRGLQHGAKQRRQGPGKKAMGGITKIDLVLCTPVHLVRRRPAI